MILYSHWKAKTLKSQIKIKSPLKKSVHHSFHEMRESPEDLSMSMYPNSLYEVDFSEINETEF